MHHLLEDVLLERGIREAAAVRFSMGAGRALMLAGSTRVRITSVVSLAGVAAYPDAARAELQGFADAIRSGVDFRDPQHHCCSHVS